MHGADRDGEVAALAAQQFEDEEKDGAKVAKRGGRYVQSAFPGAPRSLVRFGAKPSGLHDDRFSTRSAPGPKGPPTDQLIEEAKRRRRERDAEGGR